jgi:hypothetical protein
MDYADVLEEIEQQIAALGPCPPGEIAKIAVDDEATPEQVEAALRECGFRQRIPA